VKSVGIDGDRVAAGMAEGEHSRGFVRAGADRHQRRRLGAAAEIDAWYPVATAGRGAGAGLGDRPDPVPGHGLARAEVGGSDGFDAVRLDRVAPEVAHPGLHRGQSAFRGFFFSPDIMLPSTFGFTPWVRMIVYCWMKVMTLLATQ